MRSFTTIVSDFYVGSIQALPTNINNTKFGEQPALPPTCVGLSFNWASDYGASTAKPNIAVPINIGGGGTSRQKLDNVRSVRIDNLGNPVPVYVNFPDTNYTVVAPPNSVVRENVETGQFAAYIYAEGFTTGQIGSTAVYFYNYPSAPFLDTEINQGIELWKASASITRGNAILNQNFGAPALGDQTFSNSLDITAANSIGLWNTPKASGFLYITNLSVNVLSAQAGVAQLGQISIESTGISGVLYTVFYLLQTVANYAPGAFFRTGCQIKLDATETWRARNVVNGVTGSVQIVSEFTTNPT